MSRVIIIFFFIVCFLDAKATNYYFSSVSGLDSRTSLQAQNPATPWQTLTKLNSFFSSLSPGDSVLLKRSETFYGSITVSRSGSAALPIIVGAYGTGAKPVITSFVNLTLTSLGSNLYESQALLPVHLYMVTKSDVVIPMGRWPQSTYRTFQTHISNTSITDNTLTGTPNWTGAEMVLRRRRWILDRDSITSHVGTKITYVAQSLSEPYDGYGFFIQNSASTLTYQNAWYYNKTTKKLRIYSTTTPTGWKAANIDYLISNASYNYIKFDNLAIVGANKHSVYISGGSNNFFQSCDISFSGQDGMNVFNLVKIRNCTVTNSLNNGINYTTTFDSTTNTTVRNTGLWPGMGLSGSETYVGIYATNSNSYVGYNTIINSGYTGNIIDGTNSISENNFIDTFCSVKDDGAGIYTIQVKTGKKIRNNIILDGIGAPLGGGSNTYQAHGIYIDNQTPNVPATGNFIARMPEFGIYSNGGPYTTLKNNTIYDTKIAIKIKEAAAGVVVGDTVKGNILFGISASRILLQLSFLTNRAPATAGYFDSNYYVRPIFEPNNINNAPSSSTGGVISFTPGGIPGYYSLELGTGWKAFSGVDIHSKKSPKGNDVIRVEYNASQTNKVINLQPYKWFTATGQAVRDFYTIAPYGSVILIRDSLLTTVVNQAPTVSSTANLSITLPTNSTSLTATASDPESGAITYAWTKNSGPATFTIVSPTASTTNITGLVAGTYLFQIIVTDNAGLKDTAYTQVIVNAAPPINTPPEIDAGTDASITLPLDSYQLNAVASDADGTIVSYSWQQLSGPAYTIDNTAIQSPALTSLAVGKHSFRVTVTDNSAGTAYDDIDITVYPSVVNASIIIVDSIPCNGGTADVIVSATGGTEPYTGTGTFVVGDGNYQYIVTDALSQKDTVYITVTEPAILSLSATAGTIGNYLGSTTATLLPTGGQVMYEYRLNGGSWQTSAVFVVFAGNYLGEVKDSNGCIASYNFTVTQPAPPQNIIIQRRAKKYINL